MAAAVIAAGAAFAPVDRQHVAAIAGIAATALTVAAAVGQASRTQLVRRAAVVGVSAAA